MQVNGSKGGGGGGGEEKEGVERCLVQTTSPHPGPRKASGRRNGLGLKLRILRKPTVTNGKTTLLTFTFFSAETEI